MLQIFLLRILQHHPGWPLKSEKSSYAGLGILGWDWLAHFRLKTMRRHCKESSQLLRDLGGMGGHWMTWGTTGLWKSVSPLMSVTRKGGLPYFSIPVIACGSHGSYHIMNSGMMADCMETCKLGCSSLWHMLEKKGIKICCHSRRCSFCRKVVSKPPGSHVSLESLFMWDLQAMWGPSCLLRGCAG